MSQLPLLNWPSASCVARSATLRCENSGLLRRNGAVSGSDPAATLDDSAVKLLNWLSWAEAA
ncbi:MAG TPA: hypothetical protein PK306_11825 [Aquabacterium sp.]|nr:hypothetical protein [Aquabacterium sp.]HQC96386.1 hypothetical protein [Aquabacterium sp.]